MDIRILTTEDDLRRYDAWVKQHEHGSLWQSLEWKTFQEGLGRTVRIYAGMEGPQIAASALVVIDRTTFGLSTWEIPRGPLMNGKWKMENKEFVDRIAADARKQKAITMHFSLPDHAFSILHFPFSNRLVMPEATRLIDLQPSEEEILAQMKPKGRYNIKLAEKHGDRVELSPDVDAFATLMDETMRRDGFRSAGARTYQRFLELLPASFLFLAYAPAPHAQKSPADEPSASQSHRKAECPIAGLLGVIWGTTGIYYYGASSHERKELMAPYVLQWEAMQYCKTHGCTHYDLFGIAPEGMTNHPWAGVSEFKAKFGGAVLTYPSEQEVVLRPTMKTLLTMKRKILG